MALRPARESQTTTAGFSGICEDQGGEHRLENRDEKGDQFAPQAVSLLSHSCVGAQPTPHMGNLKVRELCLAALATSCSLNCTESEWNALDHIGGVTPSRPTRHARLCSVPSGYEADLKACGGDPYNSRFSYSITSWAPASSLGGTVRPSARAVLRLMNR